jgi:endonuclease III
VNQRASALTRSKLLPICVRRLKRVYGLPRHGNKDNPLEDLLYIILSRQTNFENFDVAYRQLKRKCVGGWDRLASLSSREIFQAIGVAGFGLQRTREIRAIAHALKREFGRVTLSPLKRMSSKRAEEFLKRLPGVGTKTARCVLMYSMRRRVFPVDIHCFRTLSRIGIVKYPPPIRNHHDKIQDLIPSRLRYTLHVTLVALGRDVCHARLPECERCPVAHACEYNRVRLDKADCYH